MGNKFCSCIKARADDESNGSKPGNGRGLLKRFKLRIFGGKKDASVDVEQFSSQVDEETFHEEEEVEVMINVRRASLFLVAKSIEETSAIPDKEESSFQHSSGISHKAAGIHDEDFQVLATEYEDVKATVIHHEAVKAPANDDKAVKVAATDDEAVKTPTNDDEALKAAATDEVVKVSANDDKAVKAAATDDEAMKAATTDDEAVKVTANNDEAAKETANDNEAVKASANDNEAMNVSATDGETVKAAANEDEAVKAAVTDDEAVKAPVIHTEAVPVPATNSEAMQSPATDDNALQAPTTNVKVLQASATNNEVLKAPVNRNEVVQPPATNDQAVLACQNPTFTTADESDVDLENDYKHKTNDDTITMTLDQILPLPYMIERQTEYTKATPTDVASEHRDTQHKYYDRLTATTERILTDSAFMETDESSCIVTLASPEQGKSTKEHTEDNAKNYEKYTVTTGLIQSTPYYTKAKTMHGLRCNDVTLATPEKTKPTEENVKVSEHRKAVEKKENKNITTSDLTLTVPVLTETENTQGHFCKSVILATADFTETNERGGKHQANNDVQITINDRTQPIPVIAKTQTTSTTSSKCVSLPTSKLTKPISDNVSHLDDKETHENKEYNSITTTNQILPASHSTKTQTTHDLSCKSMIFAMTEKIKPASEYREIHQKNDDQLVTTAELIVPVNVTTKTQSNYSYKSVTLISPELKTPELTKPKTDDVSSIEYRKAHKKGDDELIKSTDRILPVSVATRTMTANTSSFKSVSLATPEMSKPTDDKLSDLENREARKKNNDVPTKDDVPTTNTDRMLPATDSTERKSLQKSGCESVILATPELDKTSTDESGKRQNSEIRPEPVMCVVSEHTNINQKDDLKYTTATVKILPILDSTKTQLKQTPKDKSFTDDAALDDIGTIGNKYNPSYKSVTRTFPELTDSAIDNGTKMAATVPESMKPQSAHVSENIVTINALYKEAHDQKKQALPPCIFKAATPATWIANKTLESPKKDKQFQNEYVMPNTNTGRDLSKKSINTGLELAGNTEEVECSKAATTEFLSKRRAYENQPIATSSSSCQIKPNGTSTYAEVPASTNQKEIPTTAETLLPLLSSSPTTFSSATLTGPTNTQRMSKPTPTTFSSATLTGPTNTHTVNKPTTGIENTSAERKTGEDNKISQAKTKNRNSLFEIENVRKALLEIPGFSIEGQGVRNSTNTPDIACQSSPNKSTEHYSYIKQRSESDFRKLSPRLAPKKSSEEALETFRKLAIMLAAAKSSPAVPCQSIITDNKERTPIVKQLCPAPSPALTLSATTASGLTESKESKAIVKQPSSEPTPSMTVTSSASIIAETVPSDQVSGETQSPTFSIDISSKDVKKSHSLPTFKTSESKKVSDFEVPTGKKAPPMKPLKIKKKPKHLFALPATAKEDIKKESPRNWIQKGSTSKKAQMPWMSQRPQFDIEFPAPGKTLLQRLGSVDKIIAHRVVPLPKRIEQLKVEVGRYPGIRILPRDSRKYPSIFNLTPSRTNLTREESSSGSDENEEEI